MAKRQTVGEIAPRAAKKAKDSPMMLQYKAVKANYPDCLVFFRLGDFYEMFFEDAKTGAQELDLTLTTRDRHKPPEDQVPMCGVPFFALKNHVGRLTAKGYKVVICEQTEDPATAKGLVDRDVVRVVTPGTVVEAESLPGDSNSFLGALYMERTWCGMAFCDLSTGECEAMAARLPDYYGWLLSELESRQPRELVLDPAAYKHFVDEYPGQFTCHVEAFDGANYDEKTGRELARRQFRTVIGDMSEEDGAAPAFCALAGLLRYLQETQRMDRLPHLNTLRLHREQEYMPLDNTTRANLELTETIRGKEKKGSLLWYMDRAVTPMGHRRLKSWLERPLVSAFQIKERQDAVQELVQQLPLRQEFQGAFRELGDLERMVARLSLGGGSARELLSLTEALERMPRVVMALAGCCTRFMRRQLSEFEGFEALTAEIRRAIKSDDLPASVREGGLIAPGYNAQVDEYRSLMEGGESQILALEAAERERTGIKSLKAGYNKIFGYYLEVSNVFRDKVPPDYIRKQTLVNAERYITPQLKELEERFATARERDAELEYRIYCALRDRLLSGTRLIQKNANAIANIDAILSLATLAAENGLVRPQVEQNGGALDIVDGRHPVVSAMLGHGLFIPNDTHMDMREANVHLITGPNMAGKSTYMRQVALIVLMAQMGSYVPARSARIGVVDRVFTRIGASDDLTGGQSTFMVEMTEVADILQNATPRSLIIMDEVGRGTSTYDGMSIAYAILEYCAGEVGAKTFFSTHYHELTLLEQTDPRVRNYNIAVKKRGDKLVFLRKIVAGGADESYGVEVAQLAGLPAQVVDTARARLRALEAADGTRERGALEAPPAAYVPPAAPVSSPVLEALRKLDPNTLSPIEAWQLLDQLKTMAGQEGQDGTAQ